MAAEGQQFTDGTRTANADLSAKQFYAVKLIAGRKVDLIAASTDDVYGVLQNKPVAGAVADVATEGLCKISAGAAITEGVKVMSNSSGQAIAWTSGSAYCLLGWACEAAAGANSIIEVRLACAPILT